MILVTGASGNVGSNLVARLAERRLPVRAGYHQLGRARPPAGAEAVALDLERRESVAAALLGVSRVFLVTPTGPRLTALEGLVAEEARRAGVERIVKLSVLQADLERYTFARLHRASERLIEATGIPCTFLRPNSFMQNAIPFFAATIRSQGAFYLPAGDARVSQIDVRDVADAAAAVLTGEGHAGQAYALTGPAAPTYREVAAAFSELLGRPIQYVDVPPEAFAQTLLQYGLPPWQVAATLDFEADVAAGHAAAVTSDAAKLLGRPPRPFEAFLRDHRAAFA